MATLKSNAKRQDNHAKGLAPRMADELISYY